MIKISRIGEYGVRTGAPVFYFGIEGKARGANIRGVGVDKSRARAFWGAAVEFLERAAVNSELKMFMRLNLIKSHTGLPPVVSGTGCARSFNKAAAFAIYELIERDAFLRVWLKRIVPPRIAVETIQDSEIQFLIAEGKKRGLDTYVLDISSDIPVPVHMVALVKDGAPMVSRGFSANFSRISAIKKALYEAWGNYVVNSHLARGLSNNGVPRDLPREVSAHYETWIRPSSFERFKFLLEGSVVELRQDGTDNGEPELVKLRKILRRKGLSVNVRAAEHPVLKILGFRAARAEIPGLIPFYFGEKNIPRGHRRLEGVLLNSFPHPFA